jgi:tRNA(Ile)-lysidine synthase
MHVLSRVRSTIRRYDLATPDTRVLAAVSGGSDSVALACALRELDAARELQVVGLVHFNHQLRESAARDEAFVAALGDRLGWPVRTGRADVRARARRERRSVEDAAHAERYAFFESARRAAQADVVALGHTRDDQAETFLLRLLRGAGSRGLAGMHPRTGAAVRPLIGCRRAELRAYLDEVGAAFVEDESNLDRAIPRNRVRAELLPLLSRFNPAIVDLLADQADLAREEWRCLDAAARELLDRTLLVREEARELDVSRFGAAPIAVQRLALWQALSEGAGGRPVGFAHVEAARALLDRPGGALDAPGQRLERIDARLVLRSGPAGEANLFRYPLSIPGEVRLAEAGLLVSAELGAASMARPPAAGRVGVVRRDLCPGPLTVRNRRPGDRFQPIGLGGRKKLQDLFVDRKVPRTARDGVPIVVDEADRIVWVAGHGIDAAFRVTDASQAVLILQVRDLGGSV